MKIHPSAIVAPGAVLGEDVEIGPFTIIEDDVTIGDRCRIGAHCHVKRYVTMGAGCTLDTGVVLGGEPQDAKFKGEKSFVEIGEGNMLREYVTIHRATGEGEVTRLGANNAVMAYSHAGHNTIIGNNAMVGSYVGIGGHCTIEDRVNIGGFVGLHQYSTIGTLAMLGGMTKVNADVPPTLIADGNPMEFRSVNIIGLERSGVGKEERRAVHRAYKTIYRSEMNTSEAIASLRADGEPTDMVKRFIEFIERIDQGYRGRQNNPH